MLSVNAFPQEPPESWNYFPLAEITPISFPSYPWDADIQAPLTATLEVYPPVICLLVTPVNNVIWKTKTGPSPFWGN